MSWSASLRDSSPALPGVYVKVRFRQYSGQKPLRRPIISAGFDAHMRDPLANINLAEADFVWATQKLMDLADSCAGGRVVSLLEGGYDLQALGNSVAAHVATLMHA